MYICNTAGVDLHMYVRVLLELSSQTSYGGCATIKHVYQNEPTSLGTCSLVKLLYLLSYCLRRTSWT